MNMQAGASQQPCLAAWHRYDSFYCLSFPAFVLFRPFECPPFPSFVVQAVALHLLATLLSADKSSTALAEVCHREKVPKALLDSVVANAEGVVMQHSNKAQVGPSIDPSTCDCRWAIRSCAKETLCIAPALQNPAVWYWWSAVWGLGTDFEALRLLQVDTSPADPVSDLDRAYRVLW
jgi:hypothetical protein